MPFVFDNTYARLPDRFFARVKPSRVARPALLALNIGLAEQLQLTPEELTSTEGVEVLAGNRLPDGAEPIALAYAGHQFGNFVPQLGDGRAILLGEAKSRDGRRFDVQLKGAGRTPFSRGGDGRAAIGPVLREMLLSEAMVALGVPTTRALAAVTTGERIYRETPLPGAILTRVASSHLRIGTFQFFAVRKDDEAVAKLTDYALARHYPDAPVSEGPALALFDAVMTAQSKLVARWLALGFVHGVMNTDNMSISGETIDYGPCAFLDTFDPQRTFSSIDHGGRYAFANQPRIAQWNLARLAETLLPLVDADRKRAAEILTERLEGYSERFNTAYAGELRRKLGLQVAREGDVDLAQSLLELMAESKVDYTLCFRRLAGAADAGGSDDGVAELFSPGATPRFREWARDWHLRLDMESASKEERATLMRQANPAFIPRNHRVEEMIDAATNEDMAPFERLRRVLARPYDDQPDDAELANPPGEEQWGYRTFCGT
ncbi:MAG: YdiU family protein [Polyangiaceae bacterium]